MAIPERCLLLLSGIPATGKSTLGRHLARFHGFAHYELECYPRGWPRREFKAVWDASPTHFARTVQDQHDRVVLDWGFPVDCVPIVRALLAEGARLVWLDGDLVHAREKFIERGGIDVRLFEKQCADIAAAGVPTGLECVRVVALSQAGNMKDAAAIVAEIFGVVG